MNNYFKSSFVILSALIFFSCSKSGKSEDTIKTNYESNKDSNLIAVASPPFSEFIFPCSRCHKNIEPNHKRRELVWAHDNIKLEHDEKNRWCLDCHDANNRDKLHLADGRLLDFTESYKLCGQCHGPTLRNWLAGEHGKRTGSWEGQKQYLLCVNCHNPHSPRFKPLEPLPRPMKPSELRDTNGIRL